MLDYDFTFENDKYFYLYKHLKVSEGSLKILSKGTISFTNPKDFNDPFDCIFDIDSSYNHTTKELGNLHKKYGIESQSPAKRLQVNQKYIFKRKQDVKDGSFFLNFHEKTGVCCLNHNPLEILMWSHYADNHKGFLVEFQFPKSSNKYQTKLKNFIPIPVAYDEKMPILTKEDKLGENIHEMAKKIYLTKHSSWVYEKEFRVIANDIHNSIKEYPRDDLLSSVIFGLKISEEDRQKIVNVLKELPLNVPFYNAERVSGKYAITVPKHPRLDI